MFCLEIDPESFVMGFSARSDAVLLIQEASSSDSIVSKVNFVEMRVCDVIRV